MLGLCHCVFHISWHEILSFQNRALIFYNFENLDSKNYKKKELKFSGEIKESFFSIHDFCSVVIMTMNDEHVSI